MKVTKLTSESVLPLTCSRAGTCCHGNVVMLNPWELVSLSREKGISPTEFRNQFCELGGIRLHFSGAPNKLGKQACSQYKDGVGCTVHQGRPLACRLFPLGRQTQFGQAEYMHQGEKFPCLNGCPEVVNLPKMSVGDYLKGQGVKPFEKAQDEYLEVMQNLADIAFELLLETGLAASGDTQTLTAWKLAGAEQPEDLIKRVGQDWLDRLTVPEIAAELNDSLLFVRKHNELLLEKAQAQFGSLQTLNEVSQASVLMFSVALYLAKSLGLDTKEISDHWIEIAQTHGAKG